MLLPLLMTQLRRRIVAVALGAGVVACSRSDATPKTGASASATPAAAAVTQAADGNVGLSASAAPRDSVTDRADRGRIAGSENAKIWVIMVSDFQCPFCKQWHDESFQTVLQNYAEKGKIRLAFINFPLNIHPNAVPASEAAMCASVQNKFWPMHEALFAAQQQWAALPNPAARLESIAATIPAMDMAAWKTCMTRHSTLALVQADHDRWRTVGVGSTPAFSVNGKLLTNPDGSSPGAGADVVGAIEAALKAQR
jgi:protein-disulfide isomerase